MLPPAPPDDSLMFALIIGIVEDPDPEATVVIVVPAVIKPAVETYGAPLLRSPVCIGSPPDPELETNMLLSNGATPDSS